MTDERHVPVSDIVGAAEIAERLGLSHPQAVSVMRRRYPDSFPQPITRLQRALIWSWADVEAWARETGRLPRRRDEDERG